MIDNQLLQALILTCLHKMITSWLFYVIEKIFDELFFLKSLSDDFLL